MQIGLEAAGRALTFEAQSLTGPAHDPVVDIGPKMQDLSGFIVFYPELDRQKGRVLDDNPAFLNRGYQEVPVAFALEDG